LGKIQSALAELQDNAADPDAPITIDPKSPTQPDEQIRSAVNEIAQVDPQLASALTTQLTATGYILSDQNKIYSSNEVKTTKVYIDGLSKDVESSSQMNMIHLQSLMSSRQTAIQLATNLISSLGESSKAIAANIGR
jgi:hypothetical protein